MKPLKLLFNVNYIYGVLNFTFDQRESEVNLHKATSSPESSSNMSPVMSLIHVLLLMKFLLTKCRHHAHVYWNLMYPLSILKVVFLESNPLWFIETLISFIRAYVNCLYMPDYLFFTRSWSAIIGPKLFFTRSWSAIIGTKQPNVNQSPQQWRWQ
jgi:hypothetical protein